MYGASEAGLVSVLAPPGYEANANLPFSAGRIVDGVEVRIRHANGLLADVGEIGNIEVRSCFVSTGATRQQEAESHQVSQRLVPDGRHRLHRQTVTCMFSGVRPDVAIVDGVLISPTTIEEILCWLPDVRYAAVFAPGNGSAGYTWNALVEPWAGRAVEVARCASILESVFGTSVSNRVRIIAVDRVPQTEQGKVDRAAIEAVLQDEPRSKTRRIEFDPQSRRQESVIDASV